MVNGKKIRKRCKELGKNFEELSEALHIVPSALYHKLANIRPMDLSEARILQAELEIPDCEFKDYFLCDEKELEKGDREENYGIEDYYSDER